MANLASSLLRTNPIKLPTLSIIGISLYFLTNKLSHQNDSLSITNDKMTGILKLDSILRLLIEKEGISEATLAREINLPRNTINRIVAGKTTDPRLSTLEGIANYFSITIDQLYGKSPLVEKHTGAVKNTQPIPIITLEQAEKWEDIIKNIEFCDHHKWATLDQVDHSAKFAVSITGSGMWPQFPEGCTILVDPFREIKNKDFVLASIFKKGIVIFRQLLMDGDSTLLSPVNKSFQTIHLESDDKIIGVAIEMRLEC